MTTSGLPGLDAIPAPRHALTAEQECFARTFILAELARRGGHGLGADVAAQLHVSTQAIADELPAVDAAVDRRPAQPVEARRGRNLLLALIAVAAMIALLAQLRI